MSESLKLVAFCGSLRKASFNRLSLQAFIERLLQSLRLNEVTVVQATPVR